MRLPSSAAKCWRAGAFPLTRASLSDPPICLKSRAFSTADASAAEASATILASSLPRISPVPRNCCRTGVIRTLSLSPPMPPRAGQHLVDGVARGPLLPGAVILDAILEPSALLPARVERNSVALALAADLGVVAGAVGESFQL